MILLQMLAVIMLVPFTLVMVILFNIYLLHWLYLSFITLAGFLYASLFAFTLNTNISITFLILVMLYAIRMNYLVYRLCAKSADNPYPVLYGNIASQRYKLHFAFYFPLTFFNLIKLLPDSVCREITQKNGLSFELADLLDLVLKQSTGTRIDINNNHTNISFVIQ
jgi:hypothetical protein